MNWDSVARKFDVHRCTGCAEGDHRAGWARRNTVHWADRRMTKPGLRKFLLLIAQLRIWNYDGMAEWQRIYHLNEWAAHAAHSLHTRIPARYSDNDRARVRYLMTRAGAKPTARISAWLRIRSTSHG